MAIEFLFLIFGIALGILASTIPYAKGGISNEERMRWGAIQP